MQCPQCHMEMDEYSGLFECNGCGDFYELEPAYGLRICEFIIRCCPFCKEEQLEKMEDIGELHVVKCKVCSCSFMIPCAG